MKILLINPPFKGIYFKLGFLFPPLALAYLGAVTRQIGVETTIIDLVVQPKSLDILQKKKFDLVGISGDTSRHFQALSIAREVKKCGFKTVLGGPHVAYTDKEILKNEPSVDFIIRREGEQTLSELLTKLNLPEEYNSIKGLSYRDEQGTVFRNPNRDFIRNLDTIPLPARDLLDMNKYRTLELRRRKITPIVTSRGCPFNCPFCSASEFSGQRWRTHSIDRVIQEIEIVKNEYKYDAVAFLDDTFTINIQRVNRIANQIIDRKIDINWWCFARPDIIIKHQAMVEKMAQSGCRYVFMGMESGDDHILNRIKKGIDTNISTKAVLLLKKYGIETMASYMIGDKEDTIESINRTIDYACALPTGAAQFSITTPFPGTALFNELEPLLLHRNWDLFDCTHLVYQHPLLSPEQAKKLHNKAYRRYYLTFRRLIIGMLSFIRGKGVKLSKILPVVLKNSE